MSLTQFSQLYLPAIEEEMRLAVGGGPDSLSEYYAMLYYHLGWMENKGQGKRIRPLLTLLCCSAVGSDWRTALPVAASIELLHNFSLIHDDIQDNSPLRRGRPTLWSKWGMPQAINAGDAMFTLAHLAPHRLTAHQVQPALALAVLEELDRTFVLLTQGQYLDMDFEKRPRVSVADYLVMIEYKTAVLIAAATYLGAKLGGADPARQKHFQAYGLNLGLAFQFQDDWLGIWGDPIVIGKSVASDLAMRKKSLPVVYGLEHSPAFAQAYAQPPQPDEDLTALAAWLEQCGAQAYVEEQVARRTEAAVQALAAAQPAEPWAAALRELTQQLLRRKQ